MHRFFLPPDQSQSAPLFLTGREAHHALRVLRLHPGDAVTILDGAGSHLLCRVEQYDRDKVKLSLLERRLIPPPPCRITLLQALPKGKLFEAIIQKATELGTHRIVPIISERVVSAVFKTKDTAVKAERWRVSSVEAIKQCGSAWLPHIEAPLTPRQFLSRNEKFDLPFIASLQADARHPRKYFANFHIRHQQKPRTLSIWIGPEGDFTPEEDASLRAAGVLPISLGPLVLRTETAAIYCLSIMNYELQSTDQPAPNT
jgi:16S rRNA (uracil1498-N3)-methyltransferase